MRGYALGVVTLTCPQCGRSFTKTRAEQVKRQKHGQVNFFCSLVCFAASRKDKPGKLTAEKAELICAECGKRFLRGICYITHYATRGLAGSFCSRLCSRQNWDHRVKPLWDKSYLEQLYTVRRMTEKEVALEIGCSAAAVSEALQRAGIPTRSGEFRECKPRRFVGKKGYVWLRITGENHYIAEHRFVMEEHLGRKLAKYEIVHHLNRDKTDNRLENLVILDRSDHTSCHGCPKLDDLRKEVRLLQWQVRDLLGLPERKPKEVSVG